MPLYEYECTKCGQRVEKIQKFSDAPLTRCEKCGGELERLISSPAIQFKGTGWYVTDYGRKSSASESHPTMSPNNSEKKNGDSAKKPEPVKTKSSKD